MDTILAAVEKLLGEDHPCVEMINDAMRAHCVDAGKLVMYAVNRFPPQYRDLILLDAKTRMDEEARTLNWLLRLSGLPDDMPPDATRN